MGHLEKIMCHNCFKLVTYTNGYNPSPADSLIIHTRLGQEKNNPIYSLTKYVFNIVVTFKLIMQFWCPYRSRILRNVCTLSISWRKTKNLILWPILTITTFMRETHAYINTDTAELVKNACGGDIQHTYIRMDMANARLTWTRGKVRVKPLNINFPFWLKVWQFEGWAETSLTNLFITLYGNWNCSAPKTGHTYIFFSKGPSWFEVMLKHQ